MQAEVGKCFYKHMSRIYLCVKAKPASKKEGISAITESEISVCVKSPPVDGKANTALVKYFAEIFDVSKSDVRLERGGTSKSKLISIVDVYSNEDVLRILNENLL